MGLDLHLCLNISTRYFIFLLFVQMLSQESTLMCLSQKLGEVSPSCRNEVLTLAELQVINRLSFSFNLSQFLRARTSIWIENCTWLAEKTGSLFVPRFKQGKAESTTASLSTKTRSRHCENKF